MLSNPGSGSAIRKNTGSGSVSGSAFNQCGIRNPGSQGEPGSALESNASASLIREQQADSSSPNREQQLQGKEQQRAASSLGREQRGPAGKEQRGSGAAALKTKSNLQVGRDGPFLIAFFCLPFRHHTVQYFICIKKNSTCSVKPQAVFCLVRQSYRTFLTCTLQLLCYIFYLPPAIPTSISVAYKK
jgi:hypothetical protein